jgi:transcriptional regulator with XRE-family HTH domain
LAYAKESLGTPNEPSRYVRTIDQVIGQNLRALRKHETLTLAEAAKAVAMLTDRSISEASLSRWETGYNHFTVPDLYKWSQLYRVNVIALLQPADDVTHVGINGRDVPVDSYAYDFFIDPRGTFTERASHLSERRSEGTPNVVDALNDIRDRLGEKARMADFVAAAARIQRIVDAVQTAYDEAIENPTPENIAWAREVADTAGDWWQEVTKDIERTNNGVNQEDE